MPTTPPSATSTPGAAASAEGDATMRDLLGGKGAGLAEMTNAGLPVPPGFTITTEACNDYFAAGEQLPDGLWEDVLEAVQEVERETGKGFGDAGQPAPRERPLGRQVLDAGHDGHGPQPRPQRADAPGPHRADRQRALRLGRLPALHPDVRADRPGRRRRALRPRARAAKNARGAKQDTDLDAAALREVVDDVPGDRARGHRRATSRRTPTSSSTWPSRPSSRAGSASAPATTASTTRSPTTWAPPSTS